MSTKLSMMLIPDCSLCIFIHTDNIFIFGKREGLTPQQKREETFSVST